MVQLSDQKISFSNAMNQNENIFQGGVGVALHGKSGPMTHEAHASFVFRNGIDADSLSAFSGPFFTSQYAGNPVAQNNDNRRHLYFTTNSQIPFGESGELSLGMRFNRNDYAFFKSDQSQHKGEYVVCNQGAPDTLVWQLTPIERSVRLATLESGAHVNFRYAFGSMQLEGGLRSDYFPIKNGLTLSPRLAMSRKSEGAPTLSASLGLYHQFPTEMPSNIFDYFSGNAGLSNDSLQAREEGLVKRLQPLRCWQASCGIENVFSEALETKAEAYYKWYDREYNYLSPTLQDVFTVDITGAAALREQNGQRRAYGLELTVGNHQGRRFFYNASGSLFDVKNRYDDNTWHNDWTNVRYTFNLSAGARLLKRHMVSASLMGSGGRPMCSQTIVIDCQGRKSAQLDTTASYFSRQLDPLITANLRYCFTDKIFGVEVETFVEILNVFDYKPTLEYKFNGDRFIEVKPFGFTPIFGCSVRM
jgi:hypothetical protein